MEMEMVVQSGHFFGPLEHLTVSKSKNQRNEQSVARTPKKIEVWLGLGIECL